MHLGQLREWLGLSSRQIRRWDDGSGLRSEGSSGFSFPASSESCRYGRSSVNLARFAAEADDADPAHLTLGGIAVFSGNPLHMWLQIPAIRWSLLRSHSYAWPHSKD